jgi:hypothetical protein
MRKIGVALLLVTLVTSVWYFFAYLTWWEWNRALIAGILMVAAEIGLVTILLLSRLDRLGRRLADTSRAERIKDRLDAAPTRSKSFAWLRDPNQMNVFVPVLLGAGVIASGLAWLVERIARLTSRSGSTNALSKDLAVLAPPEGGFLGGDDDPIDLLQRPVAR